MKKSLLIYGNFIGTLVLGFLLFAIWMVKFNKPQIAKVVNNKVRKNIAKKIEKNQLKKNKVAINSSVKNNTADSVVNNQSSVSNVKKIVTNAKSVDSGKVLDKVIKKNTTPNKKETKKVNVSDVAEDDIISLDEAIAVAEENLKNMERLAKATEIKEKLQKILSDKLFIPYRGTKVIGPGGDEMPTMIAPKNLELVGICAMGGQEGAMIVVPQRKKIDKAEVLKRLQKVGSSEWAKWMVDNYMQGGKQRSNIEMPSGDVKTAAEWKAMMDEIFNEMEYNKIFFAIGDDVYDDFKLAGLLVDGVVLIKGSQEYFLPMVNNSRAVTKRNQAEIRQQDKNVWGQWRYLYRQKNILMFRSWRAKYYSKRRSKTRASSAQGASYNFGKGAAPQW